ncbi:acetoin utilization protein AcuC [Paenibacillus sp. FSL W8-1187]|uniref:Acetoin utilization protein AcuC n=1 Tax=Paenibacillus pasadenensis TaxID=217090 RepID=A0A2N5N7Q3_9BACL|nr:acetoin utilization protein AcuC [Paenibacillus pasadenensis]PLT46372.1 NAD-independent protein deacetylase AcuC [Paenibacillus pasadenensis]
MKDKAVYVRSTGASPYRFNDEHPFSPLRVELAETLLEASGALPSESVLKADTALDEQLALIHRPDYIEAVRGLSQPVPPASAAGLARRFGLDSEDTPYFTGMHEAASAIVGGSIAAADAVLSGRALHAYHMGGGLHHAFPGHGSGFCVYNDAAIAIAAMRRKHGARVLYIDTDVHHGDGVQYAFYEDPDVFTYSIHETGKYLFPGTGFTHEKGIDKGFGACCNVPVQPYTEDESWLECFTETVTRIARAFKPDLIVSQHGCDAHAFDPLSHVHCSMRIYLEMPRLIRQLAHELCDGRWVALGGGGYDPWRVVPRAWSLVWLVMSGHPLASRLQEPQGGLSLLPQAWLELWQPQAPVALPLHWLDDTSAWSPMPRRAEITLQNRRTWELSAQDY